MKKKLSIVLIILLVLIIIGAAIYGSITVINKANNEKEERKKEEKEIIDNFDKFKEAIELFNIEWSTYNTIVKDDISENTVYEYDEWKFSLDSYTEAIDKVEDSSKIYKDKCINNYYSNSDAKNKCVAFIDAYEKAINSYVTDVEEFNEKINKINDSSNSELEEYELKYEKVDINNDKIYSEIVIQEQETINE